MTYIGQIILDIPTDIALDRHAEIAAALKTANDHLALPINRTSYKSRAVESAAIVLSKSNYGACGYPVAQKL